MSVSDNEYMILMVYEVYRELHSAGLITHKQLSEAMSDLTDAYTPEEVLEVLEIRYKAYKQGLY